MHGEDPDAAFRMYLELKGSLHTVKRLNFVLELVLSCPLVLLGMTARDGQPARDGQTARAEAADPHTEADTTLCWGPSVELLTSFALCALITFLHERSLRGD